MDQWSLFNVISGHTAKGVFFFLLITSYRNETSHTDGPLGSAGQTGQIY